jgi:hypothetical protein
MKNEIIIGGESKFTNLTIKNIEVGSIKTDVEIQIISYFNKLNKTEFEVEVVDISDLTYMGMTVTSTSKIIDFHKELGINVWEEIDKKVKLILTEEKLIEIIGELRSCVK